LIIGSTPIDRKIFCSAAALSFGNGWTGCAGKIFPCAKETPASGNKASPFK
jgi:hypothetical protein